jgi:hypothetical protein|tara:strand:+ start:416 stop:700 length:285 start_codon:yes stop_codon:yes gene_type:complete
MATVDKIKNGLIDKILSIKNKDFLEALDKFISSSASESEKIELTKEQMAMLEMSEKNIKNGKLISQEAMDKRNLEWLNATNLIQQRCHSLRNVL